MTENLIIKDSKIINLCIITLIVSILALGIISKTLEQENTAVIKTVNQNNKFLNLTLQINQETYEAIAYTRTPLNIQEGDYIQLKGTIKNNQIQLTKLTKLTILPH